VEVAEVKEGGEATGTRKEVVHSKLTVDVQVIRTTFSNGPAQNTIVVLVSKHLQRTYCKVRKMGI
jgi:hypothetical protein